MEILAVAGAFLISFLAALSLQWGILAGIVHRMSRGR